MVYMMTRKAYSVLRRVWENLAKTADLAKFWPGENCYQGSKLLLLIQLVIVYYPRPTSSTVSWENQEKLRSELTPIHQEIFLNQQHKLLPIYCFSLNERSNSVLLNQSLTNVHSLAVTKFGPSSNSTNLPVHLPQLN